MSSMSSYTSSTSRVISGTDKKKKQKIKYAGPKYFTPLAGRGILQRINA
jgi:hypothetical protein